MICPYCQKELNDPIHEAEEPDYKVIFTEYYCQPCFATFTIAEKTGQIIETILASNEYRLVFGHEASRCILQKMDENYRGTYTGGRIWFEVMRLSVTPANVTPQNVANKIKTLLVFS